LKDLWDIVLWVDIDKNEQGFLDKLYEVGKLPENDWNKRNLQKVIDDENQLL